MLRIRFGVPNYALGSHWPGDDVLDESITQLFMENF